MDGVAASEVKDELNANAVRREELKAKLAAADVPPPLLHPEMAGLYPSEGHRTGSGALQHPETRSEASEALRGLIDAIVLTPNQGELQIELKGNLAAMLRATVQGKRSAESDDLSLQVVWLRGPATGGICSCGVGLHDAGRRAPRLRGASPQHGSSSQYPVSFQAGLIDSSFSSSISRNKDAIQMVIPHASASTGATLDARSAGSSDAASTVASDVAAAMSSVRESPGAMP